MDARPRLIDNPRAWCAASRNSLLVGLSYVLPGARPGFRDGRPLPDAARDHALFPEDAPVVTPSRKLSILPSLAAFAGRWIEWRWPFETKRGSTIVGWGYRTSGKRAMATAARKDGRFVLLEDGFLRSVGRKDRAIGTNLDDGGIYYDAASDSRLFRLVARPLDEAQRARARALVADWRSLGLSKYNGARDAHGPMPERYVLVIDQVRNDLSIRHGQAGQDSFDAMLAAALDHVPDATVVVKIHPDSASDPRKSHYDLDALRRDPRILVVSDTSHVARWIARAEAVFAVTSQVGFEALVHKKPVHVFGMPFYAGWGLTHDALDRGGRTDVTLEQLVHAALIDYPRYFDPVTHTAVEVEQAAALVGHNRELHRQWPETITALGFSLWKRPFIRDFLAGSDCRFVDSLDNVPGDACIAVWGSRKPDGLGSDHRLLRIEDGFLRSSGLGADLTRPLSLVIDDVGIYYDATGPSRLEQLLETGEYTDAQRTRAARLRQAIIDQRLSKYNLGGQAWQRPSDAATVVLVVGQVEDDASIRFGSPEVKTNLELLRRARVEHSDAHILYKPHPDVVAGLRVEDRGAEQIADYCDEIVPSADPVELLPLVDRVHTMTSLMGFEALMRGVPVTCHGMPFYAGWGLTEDRVACERRTRSLTIDDLVHAALIDYPRYFSPRARLFAPPEALLVELADLARRGPVSRNPLRRAVRPVLGWWKKRKA